VRVRCSSSSSSSTSPSRDSKEAGTQGPWAPARLVCPACCADKTSKDGLLGGAWCAQHSSTYACMRVCMYIYVCNGLAVCLAVSFNAARGGSGTAERRPPDLSPGPTPPTVQAELFLLFVHPALQKHAGTPKVHAHGHRSRALLRLQQHAGARTWQLARGSLVSGAAPLRRRAPQHRKLLIGILGPRRVEPASRPEPC
jgi:hypothetical protein